MLKLISAGMGGPTRHKVQIQVLPCIQLCLVYSTFQKQGHTLCRSQSTSTLCFKVGKLCFKVTLGKVRGYSVASCFCLGAMSTWCSSKLFSLLKCTHNVDHISHRTMFSMWPALLSTFILTTYSIFTTSCVKCCYYFHFTDEKTSTQIKYFAQDHRNSKYKSKF